MTRRVKRVVLLGKGDLAVRLGGWLIQRPDFELVATVPVQPEPGWSASLASWSAQAGVPAASSGRAEDVFSLDGVPGVVDLAVSVFYDRILRTSFLDRCGRAVNLHNGPLPRYRGVSPIAWALENDEERHGVTLHDITPGIDDGPIIAQATFTICPSAEEVVDVYGRALEYGWLVLMDALPLLDVLPTQPQDESRATSYTRADDERLVQRRGLRRGDHGSDVS